jgi:CO/xanthine dehydrogenase Mo-binding subunit
MGGLIGTSVPRRDAPAKVTGSARFADDIEVTGAWYGATIRAVDPHSRLLAVEFDPAFDWSAVTVVTAADIPGENVITIVSDDFPALVFDEIRYVGQAVALVAAPTPALARAASSAVRLRTEPLPAVLDPLASDVDFARYEIVRGDVEAGFAAADFVLEAEYRTGAQEHAYLEPQAMLAAPTSDGGAWLTGSMQCPYYIVAAAARVLGIPPDRIAVVQAETGGGFGGKEDYPSVMGCHAALLARAAGRPVRLMYGRHEDILATSKRHPAVVRHRTGVTAQGELVAQDIEVILDGGACATLSAVVLSRAAVQAGGPYRCPNVRIRARAAMTNRVPSGAFRGFGAPQVGFAVETHMSRIAESLGLAADEIRRRNAYRNGDTTPTGQLLANGVEVPAVLERAVNASRFPIERERTKHARAWATTAEPTTRTASGVGLALGWHGTGFTGSGEEHLASVVGIELTGDGRIRLLAAQTEIGQGGGTVMPQIAADALGVPAEAVEYGPLDTRLVPDSGPTVASRSTTIIGGLVTDAARKLRAEVEGRTGRPFAESWRDDASTNGASRVDVRYEPPPGFEWDQECHHGDAYAAFSWAGAVAWVDLDLDTGRVSVRRVVAVDECGRVVNPVMAAGQVEGGTLQSVGWATIEEMRSERGRIRNDRFATYLVPTSLDAPEIEAHLLDYPFPGSPHGAKGLGEMPMNVAAPAVIDAIHDAIGAWITELPATPERVLAAILGKGRTREPLRRTASRLPEKEAE